MNKQKKHQMASGTGKTSMIKAYIFFILLFFFGFAIILKAIHIQITEGAELLENYQKIRIKNVETEALRGNILAADGSLLATSLPIYEIRMDAAVENLSDSVFNANVSQLALRLSRLFRDKTEWEYKQALIKARKEKNRGLLIQRNVTHEELLELKTFPIFDRGRFKGGMLVERSTHREYPYGLLAKRTIGYVKTGAEDTSLVGIDGFYDQYLRGVPGLEMKQYAGNGFWRPVYANSDVEPQDGLDVVTTIEPYLQDVAHNALLNQMKESSAEKGTVVLMEVKTGEIKAMVNLTYSERLNDFVESYNHAVGEAFEPGSTFKTISMMVALEDGYLNPADSVETGDGWTMFHGKTMRDAHPIGVTGWLSPEECLVFSSNVGISKIIYEQYTGREWDFYNGLQRTGIPEKTGIDVLGEPKPRIKNPDDRNWSKITLPWMSIGYELMVTPLQILSAYNAIANDGKIVTPRLVNEIRSSGKVVKTFDSEVRRKPVCSKKTLDILRGYLEETVENGTARNIKNDSYKIAGKTGTAKVNEGGKYVSLYNASFAGYFPADNPKYSCVVVIYKPSIGSYYASQVAAPVFKEIADVVYANQFDIHPESYNVARLKSSMTDISSTAPDILKKNLGIDINLWNSDKQVNFNEFYDIKTLPDFRGLGAGDALFVLENMGLQVTLKGRGIVKKQSLAPGRSFRPGDHMYLTLDI
jgi:cell division protein FtsI (penicillin-binding protein 3)